jgi:hypothetical protein
MFFSGPITYTLSTNFFLHLTIICTSNEKQDTKPDENPDPDSKLTHLNPKHFQQRSNLWENWKPERQNIVTCKNI